MRNDTLGKLLNTVRRRLWLQSLIDRGWLGLMLASGILGLAAVLHTFHMSVTMTWWGIAALLPLAVATVAAVFNRPSLEASARAADRWLNTHDLLTAAWYIRSQTPRCTSTASLVVLNQADQVAVDTSRSLPHLRKSRHPLPTAIAVAVAVAATSLFFLSLQGAATSGRSPARVLDDSRTRDQTAEDYWLSALDSGLPDTSPVVEGTQSMREPSSSSIESSNRPKHQASPAAEEREQGEPGSNTRSKALQATQGAGAGRVASEEPPRPVTSREASDGTAARAALELVDLQRKPAGEAVAIDRAVSVELIPFASGPGQLDAAAQGVPAARAAKEPFSPSVGPAYRALQARYFEETAHGN
jgi:hypothetical protein